MLEYANLVELISKEKTTTTKGITFVENSERKTFLSYAEVYDAAIHALAYLQHRGVRPTDELVLQIEDNKTFVIVFWACILGGVIPIPISVGHNDEHKLKLFNVWALLNRPWLAVAQQHLPVLAKFAEKTGQIAYVAMEHKSISIEDLLSYKGEAVLHQPDEEDIAFVQFSSGSTGSPKGVILSHKNLIANMEAIGSAACYTPDDSTLSWMPLTHDMGLIGFHLNPLYYGMNQYIIPTNLFVRSPTIWLHIASEYQITILCSPNFGYNYVLKHCATIQQLNWDLSAVRLLYNGAEPIAVSLCTKFLAYAKQYKLSSTVMCPVYGLAEASLAVSISSLTEDLQWVSLDRSRLNFSNIINIEKVEENAIQFANVGSVIKYCSIRIIGQDGTVLPEATIGEIAIKGINVTKGYYNNPTATAEAITSDGWLRTGDLGFTRGDDVYITGRVKDIFFVNGQNYYPHDIERVAEEVVGVELNKVAVVGKYDAAFDKEEVIVFIFYRGLLKEFVRIAAEVKAEINNKIGLVVDTLIPVKDIPRTTSGKLQRFRLLERYNKGEYDEVKIEIVELLQTVAKKSETAEPANKTEEQVLAVWKNVLYTDKIGVTDNFFDIGGNSLRAAEMAMQLQKVLQVELPVEMVYHQQTIRELASKIITLAKQEFTPLPIAPEHLHYPLSSTQRGIFYYWQANKSTLAYNLPVAWVLSGDVQVPRLEHCIRQVLERHDVFRMHFQYLRDAPVLTIMPSTKFLLPVEACDEYDVDERLQQLVAPFDLSAGPLYKIVLLQLSSGKHILFMDIHHIISDGLSIYYFLQELQLLYAGKVLPTPPAQYKDYTYWENENNTIDKLKKQAAYWQKALPATLPVLRMSADFSRPSLFNTEGSKLHCTLSDSLTGQLYRFAKQREVTLHVVLLAAYHLLLAKYTGQQEAIIGIPVAGRRHSDIQTMQGMFVNNLPLWLSMVDSPSFTSYLESVKEKVNGALQHQDYPFERIISGQDNARDVSRNPVFDTMFIYQNMGLPEPHDCSLHFKPYSFDPGFSKFDISMEIIENAASLQYNIEYATSLFTKGTITRLAAHYEQLLQNIITHVDQSLETLSCVGEQEYEEHVILLNATKTNYPRNSTVQQLFAEQAAATPAAIALEYEGSQVTYAELNEKSNKLAIVLQQRGIVQNSITAIVLDKSPDLIIAILAVLKSGGAYLPVDPELPRERISYLLADSKCALIITDTLCSELLTNAPGTETNSCDVIYINEFIYTKEINVILQDTATSSDLAYVLYTSGTTGMPKGVMIEQRSLVNYICWAAQSYLSAGENIFAFYTSISFDLTITSIFVPLLTGSKVIIYNKTDGQLLLEKVIDDNKATIIKLTPSHLRILQYTEAPLVGNRIKTFIVGGEQLETRLAHRICEKYGVTIYNEYGPTEATVGCMIYKFVPSEAAVNVPIGTPAANTQVYLLDANLEPVPYGVPGELYVSGDGVARGYLYREELTRERFLSNPFIEGSRMYKTGDKAKRLPSGMIEYLGRFDQQVKINGYRIEPAEIEQQLLDYELVTAALVLVKHDPTGQPFLCTYYTSHVHIDTDTLYHFLLNRLPQYMVPIQYIQVDVFPLTQNSKVDTEALLKLEWQPKDRTALLPANETETLFLKIWSDVLQVKGLSVSDNFLEMGGDSIKAVQIVSRLFEEGLSIQVKDILQHRTISQVSLHAIAANNVYRYSQGTASGEKILSPIEGWFFGQRLQNPHFYVQSIMLNLKKPVKLEIMEQAFIKLITLHDALRLNYNLEKGSLFYNNQYLDQDFKIEQLKVDATQKDYDSIVSKQLARIKASFDITNTLLLKAAWLKDDNGLGKLFITAHHLVVDGVSWRILLEDLYKIYNAIEEKKDVKIPSEKLNLQQYAAMLQQFAISGRVAAEASYWDQIEASNFTIPTDFAASSMLTEYQHTITHSLNASETSFLLTQAHVIYRTDVVTLLNAALVMVLQEWTDQSQIIVEQENTGRYLDEEGTARTVGWFTTMYPILFSVEKSSLDKLIKTVKEQLQNVPNHGIGYGLLHHFNQLPSERRTEKISPIRFNYLGQFNEQLNNDLFAYDEQHTGADSDPVNRMTALLELNTMVSDGIFRLQITYSTQVHKEETIQQLACNFISKLKLILDHLQDEKGVHFTASDFGAADLYEEDLSVLFSDE